MAAEQFQDAQPSSLDLFSLPPTQTAIEKIYYQEVRPISQISGNSPIEFIILGQNGMEYVDLSQCKLYIKARIVHSNGSHLSPIEYVGPVNLLTGSLFSQVDVTLQGKSVTSTTNHYPYKCIFETLLSYESEAKTPQLTSQLFIKDTHGTLDDNDVKNGQNNGLYARSIYFQESKTVELEGPFFSDVFKMNRYILNQVSIGVRLYRPKGEFCLITKEDSPDFQIVIYDNLLKVCKLQINPALIYEHAEVLQKITALYPYTRTKIKMMAIPTGQVTFNWDNMFQGIRRNKLVVAFVDSVAVAGTYSTNPFNFKDYELNRIGLYVENIPIGGNPLRLNFDKSSGQTILPAFSSMFEVMGKWMQGLGNQIEKDGVGQGYAFYCFDIDPRITSQESYTTLFKQGNTRIEAQFSKALPNTVTCNSCLV